MIRVSVWLHPVLRRFANCSLTPEGKTEVGLTKDSTVGELLVLLGLPPGATQVILIDGALAWEDSSLSDGAFVEVYPIIGGG